MHQRPSKHRRRNRASEASTPVCQLYGAIHARLATRRISGSQKRERWINGDQGRLCPKCIEQESEWAPGYDFAPRQDNWRSRRSGERGSTDCSEKHRRYVRCYKPGGAASIDVHLRTGSLFATSLLLPKSRPAPKSLVLFGAGLQIRIHIQHFVKAYPTISTVYVVNRTTDGDSRNVQDMKTVLQGLPRTVKHTELLKLGDSHRVAETTRNADIIIAATSSEVPLFQSNDVRGGMCFPSPPPLA